MTVQGVDWRAGASVLNRRDANRNAMWDQLSRNVNTFVNQRDMQERREIMRDRNDILRGRQDQQLNSPEYLAQQAIMKKSQGLPISDQERAGLETFNAIKGAQRRFDPHTGAPYQPFIPIDLDSVGGAPAGMLNEAARSMDNFVEVRNLPPKKEVKKQAEDTAYDRIDNSFANTPVGNKMKFEQQLEDASTIAREERAAAASEEQTAKGKMSAQQVLDRMSELNEELNSMNALTSEQKEFGANVKAYAKGTAIGNQIDAVSSPEIQAKRDEYNRLRSTFLPFYASAAGLGAKSLDSEGERESILSSFGDPNGNYEANKNQLNNLSELIGNKKAAKESKQQPQAKPKARDLKDLSDDEIKRLLKGGR